MTPAIVPIPVIPDFAATLARIALGALFLVHGIPKIRNPKQTIAFVKGTGFPGGAVFAALFTLLEFFGGIALLLGFLTQVVGLLFALEMVATAYFAKSKLGKKFVTGWELDIPMDRVRVGEPFTFEVPIPSDVQSDYRGTYSYYSHLLQIGLDIAWATDLVAETPLVIVR